LLSRGIFKNPHSVRGLITAASTPLRGFWPGFPFFPAEKPFSALILFGIFVISRTMILLDYGYFYMYSLLICTKTFCILKCGKKFENLPEMQIYTGNC